MRQFKVKPAGLSKWKSLVVGVFFLLVSPFAGFAQGDEESQARLQKGISLYQQGQYAAALTEIEPVVVKEPANATAYRLIGLCRLQLKKYDTAIDSLKKARELTLAQEKQEDPTARTALARAYFYSEKYAEAVPELEFVVKQPKVDPAFYYLLGFAHYRSNNEESALTALNKAVELNDKDLDSWRLLAEILISRVTANPADAGLTAKATAAAQKVKVLDGTPAGGGALGRLYVAIRQFAKAVPELDAAVTAKPDDLVALFNLGLALSRSNQYDRAAAALEKLAIKTPSELSVFRELGYVYERAGKFAKALAAYESADKLAQGQDDFIKRAIARVKSQLK
jgi:tetratricopeptide (TPR) repeat protein